MVRIYFQLRVFGNEPLAKPRACLKHGLFFPKTASPLWPRASDVPNVLPCPQLLESPRTPLAPPRTAVGQAQPSPVSQAHEQPRPPAPRF